MYACTSVEEGKVHYKYIASAPWGHSNLYWDSNDALVPFNWMDALCSWGSDVFTTCIWMDATLQWSSRYIYHLDCFISYGKLSFQQWPLVKHCNKSVYINSTHTTAVQKLCSTEWDCRAMYSTVQCCTVQDRTIQHCAVLCSTVQYSAPQSRELYKHCHCLTQYYTLLHNAVQCSTVQHITVWYRIMHFPINSVEILIWLVNVVSQFNAWLPFQGLLLKEDRVPLN